jgi:hypothetical protein
MNPIQQKKQVGGSDQPRLFVKVCSKCGRQVNPHVDHNLGVSRTVYCDHGNQGPGEPSTWKQIEVVAPTPAHVERSRDTLTQWLDRPAGAA